MNLQSYLDYIGTPWGKLFYRLVWKDLAFSGKRVLDFGCGFGVTADHLAAENRVVALEPNGEMLLRGVQEHPYVQICGGIEALSQFGDESFDVILCHNVLEYAVEREDILHEFSRLLKVGGLLSVVKHNPAGKVFHKAVFEGKTEEALSLLMGGSAVSVNFGEVKEYSPEDLAAWCGDRFEVEKTVGIRTFYGLQKNEWKFEDGWEDRLFALESAAGEISPYRDAAFFHHVILRKK